MKLLSSFSTRDLEYTRAGLSSRSLLKSGMANVWSRLNSPVLELLPGWGDVLAFLPYGNANSRHANLMAHPTLLSRRPLVCVVVYFMYSWLTFSQAPPATSFCKCDQREAECPFHKSH
jgi:hypothetical protein